SRRAGGWRTPGARSGGTSGRTQQRPPPWLHVPIGRPWPATGAARRRRSRRPNAGVPGPPGPGLVRARDRGRDHGDACPEDEADGAASGRLGAAAPAALALDVEADAVALPEPAQDEAHGLGVGLEA